MARLEDTEKRHNTHMVRTIRVCLYRTRMVRKIVPYAYGMYHTRTVQNRWGLFYGTERNGTERNDGLNCGTECFLRLKLAAYHCCTSYQWHFQQVIKRYPKKDKTNLRIDCGFLLVVISNEVLIVGIADSVCSSSDISSRELNA